MSQPRIAAVLIVKNEGENLRACLQSVAGWVDEIVILDSGSSDNTLEIAAQFGARIFHNTPWPGFGKQRQVAQQHVTATWCLWLDADEVIPPELREEIQGIVQQAPAQHLYAFPRLNWYFGRYIYHCGWYPKPVVRLYPTTVTRYNDDAVHERVVVSREMSVRVCRHPLLHYPYRDLRHHVAKSSSYAHDWAQARHARGKRSSLFSAATHALIRFIRMYLLQRGFLDGRAGLLLCILSSYYTYLKYAELWILQNDLASSPHSSESSKHHGASKK